MPEPRTRATVRATRNRLQAVDGTSRRNLHCEHRRWEMHHPTRVPETCLFRDGPQHEARLWELGHVLSENRHHLDVDA